MYDTLSHPAETKPLPEVVGTDLLVPVVSGERLTHANLDHAATTPCLEHVRQAVQEVLPWYASVHRGAGFPSQVVNGVYERARRTVREFVGAPSSSEVVFTRNTTDALNLLSRCVPPGTTVVRFDTEHHAALLPWNDSDVVGLGVPASPRDAVRALDAALAELPAGPTLVVITAASNVTGELWPVAELTDVARRHGARTVLDAAQLAARRRVHIGDWGVDWVALSGHKMYAPFGAGALVGRTDWLSDAAPYLAGGGATAHVAESATGRPEVSWCSVPSRHEAGTPNVVGVHALAAACEALTRCGQDDVIAHEQALVERLHDGIDALPGVRSLRMWPDADTVGVVSFAVRSGDATQETTVDLLAAALAAEHAVSVRAGLFCAHLLTRRLLDDRREQGSALRASVGLGSRTEHVDRLLGGLEELLRDGPRAAYRMVAGKWSPNPDPRPMPAFVEN